MNNLDTNSKTFEHLKQIVVAISIAISILVVISAIFGVYWLTANGPYHLMQTTLIQPGYERTTSQFELLGVESDEIVFLGDSLIEYGRWHELFPRSKVLNRGIAGDTTIGVLSRLDQITEGQPDQVFLMIGTNDLLARVPETEIVTNIIQIVDEINTVSPGTTVYLQSILPGEIHYRASIEWINQELEVSIAGKAIWVDLYPLFLGNDGTSLNSTLSNDGLHLNGEGYIIWRDAIIDFVNR